MVHFDKDVKYISFSDSLVPDVVLSQAIHVTLKHTDITDIASGL